jgi:Fic family protein
MGGSGGVGVIARLDVPVSPDILKAVAAFDRFQGSWSVSQALPADRLERVAEAARIQSIGASIRLSGIRLSDEEVAGLLAADGLIIQDAQEVRGYAAAIDHALPDSRTLLESLALRRLQAVLMGDSVSTPTPGPWRSRSYYREAFDDKGRATGIIFPTAAPRLIAKRVEDLLTWLEYELRAGERHQILVIGTFVLGLLAVSPFERGNSRCVRVLISHLLRRAGYDYIAYASIEHEMELMRGNYYEAYALSQMRFWTGQANLEPWLTFFVTVLDRHRQRVEEAVGLETAVVKLAPLQKAIMVSVREHGTVDAGLLLKSTGANRNTLKDNLRRLVQSGALIKIGEKRGTRYELPVATETGTFP